MDILITTLLVSLGLNTLFFILAYILQTDSFTDFTYSASFIVMTVFTLIASATYYPYQITAALMVTIWALRLMGYLVMRIRTMKRDTRFDEMRAHPVKFASFWLLQAVSAWVILLPVTLTLSHGSNIGFDLMMIGGLGISILGLGIETIADWQKYTFKRRPQNRDRWIETGLWKRSRHPNYFGEMLMWWGVFVYSVPLLSGLSWGVVAGPVLITYLLLYVSGIPLLEKRYDEKYKGDKKYLAYKRSTNLLIPWV